MNEVVVAQAKALLKRIEKEVKRFGASTVTVGGLTKVGNETERLVRALLTTYWSLDEDDLREEAKRREKTPGPGTYLCILRDQPGEPPVSDLVGRALVADARSSESHLLRLAGIRRRNVHPDWEPGVAVRQTLEAGAAWLGRVVSLGGGRQ